MNRNVIGFVLIDTPHSALNNAGQDSGNRTENAVVVKTLRRGRSVYPYVSAQAWRYWWRRTLQEKFEWHLSPVTRETKIAFTSANPFQYPDDDVFGYMRAQKNNKTLTRLSPLKCSPLVSVYESNPVDDFGVMARQDGDPVPFEHQFYSTIMKGIFSLNLRDVGVFQEGVRTGYKNLDESHLNTKELQKSIEKCQATKKDGDWVLPKEDRCKRSGDTICALSHIYSTTKSALHLTDVTPRLIILAVIEGGNHLFMNITDENPTRPIISLPAFKQIVLDYRDIILSDIFIGRQAGFFDNLDKELHKLKGYLNEIKTIHLVSPRQAIEIFAESLTEFIE